MSTNTPIISKSKTAIADHIGWADVHLDELRKVLGEISNSDFHERCSDIFRELVATLPYFTSLCKRTLRTHHELPSYGNLKFEQVAIADFVDPSLQDWVNENLGSVERVAKETFSFIRDRDGVEVKPELRRKFPAAWMQQSERPPVGLHIPGQTLEVGEAYAPVIRVIE
jgi:hypothetical protein